MEANSYEGPFCPLPLTHSEKIVLGHGSGGKMTHDLIKQAFIKYLSNSYLLQNNDAASIQILSTGKIAISTDSHVVWPIFFPGGDIGKLAVCGTVNDLSMMGATPLYLTAGFILEEGLDISVLEKVVSSMKSAAEEAGVQIIAGDTKVVQKGKADSLYITTSGIGAIPDDVQVGGAYARPGDVVILSGVIGNHGIAVLEARGELGFSSNITSDIAPLNHLVSAIIDESKKIHVLRDPTRGGVATTLNEIARQSNVCITIDENQIPVEGSVKAVCEILGYDPLYIANEGKLIAIVPENVSGKILEKMRKTRYGEEAVVIGYITESPQGRVLLKTSLGTNRIIEMLSGEMLPRIC
jgi:hydrogenase expression/formation protein HypE